MKPCSGYEAVEHARPVLEALEPVEALEPGAYERLQAVEGDNREVGQGVCVTRAARGMFRPRQARRQAGNGGIRHLRRARDQLTHLSLRWTTARRYTRSCRWSIRTPLWGAISATLAGVRRPLAGAPRATSMHRIDAAKDLLQEWTRGPTPEVLCCPRPHPSGAKRWRHGSLPLGPIANSAGRTHYASRRGRRVVIASTTGEVRAWLGGTECAPTSVLRSPWPSATWL